MNGRYPGTCTCTCSTTIVSGLEGSLLKSSELFPYFMLVAFEASGLIRFISLLLTYPLIKFFDLIKMSEVSHKMMIFVAVAGVKIMEVEAVSRAVLPKFYMDDVEMNVWNRYIKHEKRVVVSKFPRIMVERFVKDHLMADDVIGYELEVNRAGIATGFVKMGIENRVKLVAAGSGKIMPEPCLCKGHRNLQKHAPPKPVIFHDGRLVLLPTPLTSLLIILYFPVGIAIAFIRILVGSVIPMRFIRYFINIFGGRVIVRGHPPPLSHNNSGPGVLFVCTHRTLMDPVVLSMVLGRAIPAATYSISRLTELLSPIRTVRLSRNRELDSEKIRKELERGDVVVCPEGTTCREGYLLRFSALFAELSERIVPVAMNSKLGLFHATTARGWKGLDPIFFFMNPRPVYEVTFLKELGVEETCSAGRSACEVANYVQRVLGDALGFECTNLTRKDKYRVLAGNDGIVNDVRSEGSWSGWLGNW